MVLSPDLVLHSVSGCSGSYDLCLFIGFEVQVCCLLCVRQEVVVLVKGGSHSPEAMSSLVGTAGSICHFHLSAQVITSLVFAGERRLGVSGGCALNSRSALSSSGCAGFKGSHEKTVCT